MPPTKTPSRPTNEQRTTKNEKPFTKAYKTLNPAQKKAVETIEGPVMVIAGPGTGKTQTVAMRVANILKKTHARPSNILCLTFTKSGATAMRERLRSLIGSDAYGVTIDTIHGFCNGIINTHPEVFEEWASNELEQISDIERYRTVNKIIDELMPDMILVSRKNPYARTKQIIDKISQFKREGVTSKEELMKVAKEFDDVMKNKSRDGTKQHEKNLRTARKFRELIAIFLRYQAVLEEAGRYDYEDMILKVTEALKVEDWLLASLQERYQYVLLDEVQDTNGAQWQFVDTLMTDPTADKSPNLFVVGDDDQAIFRFQGANLQNILAFRERYPQAEVITLQTSYRCTQSILDAAGKLIAENEERLVGTLSGITKNLVATRTNEGQKPILLRPPSDMSEPWMIADLIEEKMQSAIPAEEIAVIVQTNAELLPIYDVLRSRKLPVEMTGKVDLLAHPLISQVVTILEAIANPGNNHLFANALACKCFAVPAVEIARMVKAAREQEARLIDLDLNEAGLWLLSLSQRMETQTIVQTLEEIFRTSGLLRSLGSKTDADKELLDITDIAVAQEFFDRMKNRAYEDPLFSLYVLMHDLQFYQNPEYRDLRMSYDLPHLTEKGVKLMTAHKSKGLEFHTVIIANFREGRWDGQRTPPGIAVPEDLLYGWGEKQKKFEKTQDERRVCYVAMTRAREQLFFSCPHELTSGDSVKSISPSAFFAESGDLSEEPRGITAPEKASTLLHPILHDRKTETTAFLKEQVEHFALSPSALNDFLEDPALFVERHLLRLPQARNPSYAYGNAIHHVLADWGNAVRQGKPLEESQLLQKFEDHLETREVLTPQEKGRLTHLGKEALRRYYSSTLCDATPFIHKVEFPLRSHLGDVPIKGKIDRIDLAGPDDPRATVYDYKTGKPKTEKQIETFGYKRQLVFYDLLVRSAMPILKPQEYVLAFVGEDAEAPRNMSFSFTDSDRAELTELIEKVWEKILALDFTAI